MAAGREQVARDKFSATKSRILHRMLAQMAEIQAEAVAERIIQARKEAGLTQQDVAELLGIDKRSYQDYEGGVRVPYRRLGQLADVLGTTKRWLLHGDEEAVAPLDAVSSTEMLEAIRELTTELRRANERWNDFEGGGSVDAVE